MTAPIDLYPLSTKEGNAVPLDVIRPNGVIRKSFTSTGTSPIALPNDTDIYSLFATENCYVLFADATITLPADGSFEDDILYVPVNTQIMIRLPDVHFSVISASSRSGELVLQSCITWHGIALASQFVRS